MPGDGTLLDPAPRALAGTAGKPIQESATNSALALTVRRRSFETSRESTMELAWRIRSGRSACAPLPETLPLP
jgi:hypothetical protein